MKRIYLAGPIANCSDADARDWRHNAASWLFQFGAKGVDPMRRDYREEDVSKTFREIVDLDKRDIMNADCVLVYWSKISIGTAMEILYAWSLGIPVIVANAIPDQGVVSPWILYHSTNIVNTLDDALNWIRKHIIEE